MAPSIIPMMANTCSFSISPARFIVFDIQLLFISLLKISLDNIIH